MGRLGGYLGYMFTHENRRQHQDGWEVHGTVFWTLHPDRVQADGWVKILREWSTEGYKIGLLIREDQTIQELIYGEVPLAPVPSQPSAVRDLGQTYGTFPGHKWVAWGGTGTRKCEVIQPIVVTFSVRMKIVPASSEPQVIPVASRHLDGSFAHSMAGHWAIGGPKRSDPKQSDASEILARWIEEGQRLLRTLGGTS